MLTDTFLMMHYINVIPLGVRFPSVNYFNFTTQEQQLIQISTYNYNLRSLQSSSGMVQQVIGNNTVTNISCF